MRAGADRQNSVRGRRRRALAGGLALVVALAVAGCSDSNGAGGSTGGGPPLVTGEQVVSSCFHAYFYNGILPKSAAQANCQSCVVAQLRKLGVRPTGGENVVDMLTGDRLASADIQSLQSNCNVSDASSQ